MQTLSRVGVASLFLAVLGAVAWLALHHSPEARFQGKTAREWFRQCAESVQSDGTIQDGAAFRAVLHLGEPSVPCLAEALQRRKAAFAEDWNRMRNRLPAAATNVLPHRLETREAWQKTWAAHEIVAAAPLELKRAVAKAAVPSLLAEVRSPRVEDRSYRLSFMQVLEPDPGLVVPDLNRFLTDADPMVRQAACGFLRRYGRAAQPAMSNLLRVLTNGEPNTIYARAFAMEALGGIGPEAKPAVPVLVTFLNHSNSNLCAAATNALRQITSEAVPGGGPK